MDASEHSKLVPYRDPRLNECVNDLLTKAAHLKDDKRHYIAPNVQGNPGSPRTVLIDIFNIAEHRVTTWYGGAISQKNKNGLSDAAKLILSVFTGSILEAKNRHRSKMESVIQFWKAEHSGLVAEAINLIENYQNSIDEAVLNRDLAVLNRKSNDFNTRRLPKVLGSNHEGECLELANVEREYTESQSNSASRQTRAILRELDHLKAPGSGLAALRSLAYELPSSALTPIVERQKFALYGGIRAREELPFSALQHSVMGWTFKRNIVERLVSDLVVTKKAFSSHSIVGQRGQGASIALAQAILSMCKMPGWWLFWSFGGRDPFTWDGDSSTLSKIENALRKAGPVPSRIGFVFDDFHKRTGRERLDIIEFQDKCRVYAETGGLHISFLYSSDSASNSASVTNLEIVLEEAEEQRVFELMADIEPRVIIKTFDSLNDLLLQFPEKRRYKDDVQSLIDLIYTKSKSVHSFKKSWFAALEEESDLGRSVLPSLTVSQLFDAPLPSHIAIAIVESAMGRSIGDDDLDSCSDRIAWTESGPKAEWPGYVLSSPYYARSLLRQRGEMNPEFVEKTLSEIIALSLTYSKTDLDAWADVDSHYLQHIFQRLSKNELYRDDELKDKALIADMLFAKYGSAIAEILHRLGDIEKLAKWAGTFSALSSFRISDIKNFSDDPKNAGRIVYELCRGVVLGDREILENAQVVVTLLRAVRQLCRKFRGDPRIDHMVQMLDSVINIERIVQLSAVAKEDHRRINIVILTYVNFIKDSHKWNRSVTGQKIFEFYNKMERDLHYCNFQFDAGNLIERAVATLRAASRNSAAYENAAQYLRQAGQFIRSNVREQGTWQEKLVPRIQQLQVEFPILKGYLGEDLVELGLVAVDDKNK